MAIDVATSSGPHSSDLVRYPLSARSGAEPGQDVAYNVPARDAERMKRAWQEVAPPAWQTAVQHSNDGDSDAVITAVLLSQIPGMDAKVETAATADAIPAGAVANAGAGGNNKKSTKNKRKRLFVHFFLLLFFFVFLLFLLFKQYRHRPAEDQIPWVFV